MPAPEEIVAAPLTIYLAPVGTDFPAIDLAPGSFETWAVLGTEGDANYDDTGVQVDHTETVNDFTPAGLTMPSKRFRTGEAIEIKLNLVDVSPTAYATVMNNATITTTAAASMVAGNKAFSLFRGILVNSFAVLARGLSSVDNTLNMQYEISEAFVSVNGTVTWNKGVPAMLPVDILAVVHSDDDVIICRIETAPAT